MEHNADVWIRFVADDYAATLTARSVLEATPPGSYLSTLVDFELKKSHAQPTIRLNCSAEEARELIAAVRQGSSYEPPANDSRVLSSLKRTFDFLGLPSTSLSAPSATQEILMIPSYYIGGENPGPHAEREAFGVLMYSSSMLGWANRSQNQDFRPARMKSDIYSGHMGSSWLAAVLRKEATGAVEDLCYMLPNEKGGGLFSAPRYQPVQLCSTLQASAFATPNCHVGTGGAAMTAACGKLYLLGGVERVWQEHDGEPSDEELMAEPRPGILEVYNPRLDTWFAATSPVPGHTLKEHVLVTNRQEGMLLALGGRMIRDHGQQLASGAATTSWAQLGMYDMRSGRWTLNPSGCSWPAVDASSGIRVDPCNVAATATADDYNVMVLRQADSSLPPPALRGVAPTSVDPCHVDLLDLRMWRFRPGRALQRHYSHGVSLAEYDGKVIAVGGSYQPVPIMEYGEWSSKSVSAYDVRTDTWSDMPDLPSTMSYGAPVVMRLPSVLPHA